MSKQSGAHMRHSAAETARIKSVKFTLLSKEEIDRWAVVEVNNPKLYSNREPTDGGLNDLHMGISSVDQKCKTCGESKQCQGHFGVIKLPEPIFHYGFLKFVEKVLKCICNTCSRLRKPTKDGQIDSKFKKIVEETRGRKRLIELSKLLINVTECEAEKDPTNLKGCKTGCGSTQLPNIIQIKGYKIITSYRMTKQQESTMKDSLDYNQKAIQETQVTAENAYNLFKNIDPYDARILGFTDSKPIDLLISSLLVCPPQLRPIVDMNPQKKAEDSMTIYYSYILNGAKEIKDKKGSDMMFTQRRNRIQALQLQVASIMQKVKAKRSTGTTVSVRQNSKPVKSFAERLKGKEGRFRQHLMGKRVDFSARSVISPDSNLALDELGVPQKIAAQLTFPEQITSLNINRIKKLYEEGKVLYFLKPTQDRKKYEPVQAKDFEHFSKQLTYGVVAQRCLQDGDFVLFNRQPTLHRMSMMGHRVKILPYNTFRLNLSVCAPYNADFDGDEMNMHVPQSYETLAEIKHITHVPRQIVTPKNNQPVMGMVQDALLGIYLFTLRDTFLTREEVMSLVIWIESIEGKEDFQQLQLGELPMPAILKPIPLWTGKQIMSMIIPSKISIAQRSKDKSDDFHRNYKDSSMIIRRGQLIMGALQKEIVGSGAGGLIHNIWLDIGPDATCYFLTTAQRIVNAWLTINSFSVGAADVVPSRSCYQAVKSQLVASEAGYWEFFNIFRSEQKIDAAQNLHHKEKTIMESFDVHANQELNNVLGVCQKLVTTTMSPFTNNIYKMISAKSKGNETNLTQIVGLVGQQNIDGKMVAEGFRKRTLPHFCKNDKAPQPRGFLYSSLYAGLKPHEFFFYSMSGREGLSDTAVKTARTGYIQRKLIKALEDVIVKYDGTVRDSQNNIVQFMYGEDGFAAEFIEKQAISLDEKEEAFEKENHWDCVDLISNYKIGEEGIEQLEEEYQELVRIKKTLANQFLYKDGAKDIYCPIKVERLINNIKQRDSKPQFSVQLSPLYVVKEVEKLLEFCIHPQHLNEYREMQAELSLQNDSLQRSDKQKRLRRMRFEKKTGLQLFRNIVKLSLSSKKICKSHCLTKAGFTAIIELIKAKFAQALINPGEAIGAIAAQSVGEPTTQMTLNTFHSAGIKARNVTLGVPRLQQLLQVSRNMKNTSLKIYLKKDDKAVDFRKYVKELPQIYLGDFIAGCKIYYDFANSANSIENKNYSDQIGMQEQNTKVTPWLMMLILDWGYFLTSDIEDKIKNALTTLTQRFARMTKRRSPNPEDNKIYIYLRCLQNFTSPDPADEKKYGKQGSPDFNYYRFLKDKEAKLRAHRIEGIDNIKKVFTMADTQNKDEKILITEGSNLMKILSLPTVDSTRTVSNSITEVLDVLGIEAARQSFLVQFREVLKPYDIYINYRHLATLADWMTRRGKLTQVNRNGINRISDVSVLRKASFEQTVEILYDAAIFSQVDPLKGVSEKIIVGDNVEIGTGNFKILIDKVKVKDFKIANAMDNKEDLQYETKSFDPYVDPASTPKAFMTPGPNIGSMYSPGHPVSTRGAMSPAAINFTPSNLHNNRFTPDIMHGGELISGSRSPAAINALNYGTPIGFNGGQMYSPTSSPTYTNSHPSPNFNLSRLGANSPYHSQLGPIAPSPRYGNNSTISPNYRDRSAYNSSSRMSQSPRYSPISNHSPSYSGTPADRPKDEEKSDNESDDQ